ncbi:MAG TPA: Ada metal-binding domain-containing protein [Holophagaceae bacterium]
MMRWLAVLCFASAVLAAAQAPKPTRAEKKAAKKAAQTSAAPAPAAKPVPPQATPVAAAFVGNRDSKTFHRSGCTYVAKMKAANRVAFATAAEAAKAGYKPCKVCKPQ